MNKRLAALALLCPSIAFAEPLKLTIEKPFSAQVTPSASEARAKLAQIPGGASVVGQENWQAESALTIDDMLDYAPGVFIQPRNGGEASRLSIRGSGLAEQFQGRGILLLQDGVPINSADGSFEFAEIDPWLTDYAEIYRGANALEFGASTLGGAINFVSPTGQSARGAQMRGELGSFGTQHSQASYGMADERMDLYAAATGFEQQGYRSQNEQQTRRFTGNLGWQVNSKLQTRMYLAYNGSHSEIPGTLSKAELFDDPRQAKPINAAQDYARFLDSFRIANKTAWEEGDLRLESTLYARASSLENPVFTYISDDTQELGWRGSWRLSQGAGEWQGGVNLAYNLGKELRYDNAAGQPGTQTIERREQASANEAYLQYSHALTGALTGIASGQVSYHTRRIEERLPGEAVMDRDFVGINPRIGLLYDVAENMQLFSNLSRSFEPPTLGNLSGGNDPGFTSLDAQSATTLELGSRGNFRRWQWDLAFYHSELEDELLQFQFPDGDSDTINAGDTVHDGMELGISGAVAEALVTPADALRLRASYQWNYFRLRDNGAFKDNELPGAAPHYLRSELFYEHAGFGIGPNIEWVPEAPQIDLANSVTAQDYLLLGARATFAPRSLPALFYMEARNLLDKTYIATYDPQPDAGGSNLRAFYPGEGRAVYAGLRWQL